MSNLCDLHTHSLFSDGTCTPEEIIDSALEKGLSAVALCDHNCVAGLPRFLAAAEGKDICAIPGAEFSVDYNGTELHLLGLFLRESSFAEISRLMGEIAVYKEKSNIELAQRLNDAGIAVDYKLIKGKTLNGNVNRTHFAEEIISMGLAESMAEAFKKYLSEDAGYYKEPKRLTVWEAMNIIKNSGGAAVLAHPFLNLTEEELIEFLPIAKEKGLVGMECYYSEYDEKTTETALSFALKFGLCPSGGSDFHGDKKPSIKLGVGKGNLKIPFEWAEKIKKEI